MTEHQDPQEQESSRDGSMTRRYFLELVGAGALGVSAAGALVLSGSYLSPNVVKEPPTRFKVGAPEEFPPGSVTLDKEQKIFIVRSKEGSFYALSAVCTHLGCIANWKPEEDIIACPCHGSKFRKDGSKAAGPAPKPLPRFAMSIDEQGQLVVDKGQIVGDDVILKV